MQDALEGWNEYNVALAGAGAALVGLLIVAMSVNIEKILQSPSLPARAASAIGAMTAGVAFSLLALIPDQPVWALGLEVLIGAALLWWMWLNLVRHALAGRAEGHPAVPKYGIAIVAPAVYTVGGVLLVLGMPAGVLWVGIGSIVAIIAGVVFAWVALVEILR